MTISRRGLLLGMGVAALPVARPALAQGAAARTLRFVPQANLANFDPIWGTQFVVRNAAMLVWDTLFGVDTNLVPRHQMLEGHEVSPDGLTWTLRLRPALRFHDGEPVLARDVVASLTRWSARDPMGQMIKAIQNELVAVDDRTIRWVLKSPYPKLPFALGKTNGPCAFIMPERIARTDPFQQIGEYVGSGPMRFRRDEWVPGAKAVFERSDRYVPRDEPAAWMAGGKRIAMERIEWVVMADPATAAAALQNGEVDWWENPIADLVPVLKRHRDVMLDIADPLGNIGALRMNWLHPPFNDARVRRALMMALDQEDYMRALVGDDTSLWKRIPGFFTPGTPLYTEVGGDILKGPRRIEEAKRLVREAGHAGTNVVMLVAQDVQIVKVQGDVTADVLEKIGLKVDYVATDWGTVGTRRTSKEPPSRGGWNIFFSWFGGADCATPASYTALRANGAQAWFGWPDSPETEAGRNEWFAASTPEAEKAAMEKTNTAAVRDAVFAPTGFFLSYQAWRRNVQGVVKAPLPLFWDVKKG